MVSAVAPPVAGHHVLVYHSVVPEPWHDPYEMTVSVPRFEEQMAVLSRAAKVVSLDGAGPGCVSVCFDDGFADSVSRALPVLRHYRMVPTLFVIVEATERGRFTHLPAPPPGREWSAPATWNELAQWVGEGFRIGLHGWDHTSFTAHSLSDLRSQLRRAVSVLEDRLGYPVEDLAYPYGDYGHVGPRTAGLVRELGFKRAYTAIAGANRPSTSPMLLKRLRMTEWDSATFVRRKIEGRFAFYGAYQRLRYLVMASRAGAYGTVRRG